MADVGCRTTERGNLGKIKVSEVFLLLSEWAQGEQLLPLCQGVEAAAVTWCLCENLQLRQSTKVSTELSKIAVVSKILSVGWETGTSSSELDPGSLGESVPKDYRALCPRLLAKENRGTEILLD